MAQAHWKSAVLFSALSCASHFAWGAGKAPAADEFDGGYEQSYAEIPVESIQQFVQIYGIVKDNYVKEKTDDELFQQAIKGLVSGLDRYSRYLPPEDYKQLLQYTEG
ncbi:MAG: S41 family peptidase, partial [Acinetobacter sp.]|nr:S41 family peptidase [Acinetobacter sp.]